MSGPPVRIALLGDVHGNLPALDAVLEDARAAGAGAVWNAGDAVGYGPFPDETVRRLRDRGIVSVTGNYDMKVLSVPVRGDEPRFAKRPLKRFAFRWAYEQLSPESRAWLDALPWTLRLDAAGRPALLVHGSPVSLKEHLGPDTPRARFEELAPLAAADLVVCGHSHRSFVRDAGGVRFVNVGSVGRPDDGDWRAEYALLAVRDGTLDVEHRRVAYDLDATLAAVRDRGLPEAFARMFATGRKLEVLIEGGVVDDDGAVIPGRG